MILAAWLDYLGISTGGTAVKIDTLLTAKIYEFVAVMTSSRAGLAPDLPNVVANRPNQHVRIPGNMKPHSVAMHPTPQLRVAVGWRSPVRAAISVEAQVQHAASGVRQRSDLVARASARGGPADARGRAFLRVQTW